MVERLSDKMQKGIPTAPPGSTKRRHVRADLAVKVRLTITGKPNRQLEATLASSNISIGGMFLESTFFLKLGTEVDVELTLPPRGRKVRAHARVVRVDSGDKGSKSGFALRVLEYLDGSEVALANYFLAPKLRSFVEEYVKRQRLNFSPETFGHLVDVLAAWEVARVTAEDEPIPLLAPDEPEPSKSKPRR